MGLIFFCILLTIFLKHRTGSVQMMNIRARGLFEADVRAIRLVKDK